MTPPAPRRRRALTLAAIGAGIVLLLCAGPAAADVFTPESGGSPNADRIDTLYKLTFFIGLVVFVGVEGALVYCLVRYRARRGAPPPDQIRGNTRLEIGWTIGAALVLVVLTAVTFAFLGSIQNPEASGPTGLAGEKPPPGALAAADRDRALAAGTPVAVVGQRQPAGGPRLEIAVNGQQYLWRYDYPGRGPLFSYYRMVVPTNTTVLLKITSQDVNHSWWIPKLGGKHDAVPGHVNETWFKALGEGVYKGQCAELCGSNHAEMLAEVEAVSPPEFEAWAARQTEAIRQSQAGLADTRRRREQGTP